jgi:glutamate/tyrosine decarboxylase-like PLP-dependent enzyme
MDHRRLFERAAAHAADFVQALPSRLQRPGATYQEMRPVFDAPTPETGQDGMAVIEELVAKASPGLSAMAGPRFFGWVIGASHPVGVAADFLTSAWGQNAGAHTPTPAAAAAEEVAAKWLLDLLGLPRQCSVGFVTGATAANFTCLAAGRSEMLRRVGWDVEAKGLFEAPPVHVLIGEDAHTSVFAALQFLGLGHERVVRVATDDAGRIRSSAFANAARACTGPVIAIAQAGQINTGAFDPIGEIAGIAGEIGAWLHVDGAFGLWARACADVAGLARGLELADSWATDGHKWLQTPYDCGFAITRHPEAHSRAMTISASYLPILAAGERNPSHFVPELSRRARGFATWAVIKTLGRQGIAEMIGRHCRIAQSIARTLAAEPGIEIVNRVELNQIAVRFGTDEKPGRSDELTAAVIERVQADGVCFVAGAQWRDRWIMRVSVVAFSTTDADAEQSAQAIIAAWRKVQARSLSNSGSDGIART